MILQDETSTNLAWGRLQTIMITDSILEHINEEDSHGYAVLQKKEMNHILAHSYRVRRDYPQVLEFLDLVIKKDPKDKWTYGEKAFVYYEKGNLPAAIQMLPQGLKAVKHIEKLVFLWGLFIRGKRKNTKRLLRVLKETASPRRNSFLFGRNAP